MSNSPVTVDFAPVSRFSTSTVAPFGRPFRGMDTRLDGDSARRNARTTPSFFSGSLYCQIAQAVGSMVALPWL